MESGKAPDIFIVNNKADLTAKHERKEPPRIVPLEVIRFDAVNVTFLIPQYTKKL